MLKLREIFNLIFFLYKMQNDNKTFIAGLAHACVSFAVLFLLFALAAFINALTGNY